MKTRELIRQLQEIDPTGEIEVCIGNADIWYLETKPAYWDGCLQVLKRDPDKAPYYDICGGEFRGGGTKIDIRSLSIYDAVSSNTDLPVEFDGSYAMKKYEKLIEKEREICEESNEDCEKRTFMRYVEQRFGDNSDLDTMVVDDYEPMASEFYDKHLSYKNELLPGQKEERNGYVVWDSYVDRRKREWDERVGIDIIDGVPIFVLRDK